MAAMSNTLTAPDVSRGTFDNGTSFARIVQSHPSGLHVVSFAVDGVSNPQLPELAYSCGAVDLDDIVVLTGIANTRKIELTGAFTRSHEVGNNFAQFGAEFFGTMSAMSPKNLLTYRKAGNMAAVAWMASQRDPEVLNDKRIVTGLKKFASNPTIASEPARQMALRYAWEAAEEIVCDM